MIPYIIYVALVTAVYFLVYRLLLHKETFFRLNRWFFLIGVISSFALPLLPVPKSWTIELHQAEVIKPPATDPGLFGPVSTAVTLPPKVQNPVARKRHHEAPVLAMAPATAALAPLTTATPTATTATPTPATPRITLASVLQWLYYAYICGVLIFGVNLLLQIIVLWYQVRRNPIVKDGIFRIVRTRGNREHC
jgi:hypothetical protein